MIGMARQKLALIVRGGWEGHQPVETTDSFIPFLRTHGYEVVVASSPSPYADTEFMSSVDLVVQCVTMSTAEKAEVDGLRAAVAAGTGLVGWHGGIVDSYRNSADYLQLVGGQFANHPAASPGQLTGNQSDYYVAHRIAFTEAGSEHFITTGIADFDLDTEQYWVLTDDYNDVLATTTLPARPGDPWRRPIIRPAVWTRNWAEGRIVVCTPGHNVEVLKNVNVRTIIERGMLWASR
ncbi:MAG: hypothetical protein JWQ64_3381 [Subtercola sp.]|jgi:type 1 glutamine amidotransferase|nr:hypothetical protein [Subtercola sp.]